MEKNRITENYLSMLTIQDFYNGSPEAAWILSDLVENKTIDQLALLRAGMKRNKLDGDKLVDFGKEKAAGKDGQINIEKLYEILVSQEPKLEKLYRLVFEMHYKDKNGYYRISSESGNWRIEQLLKEEENVFLYAVIRVEEWYGTEFESNRTCYLSKYYSAEQILAASTKPKEKWIRMATQEKGFLKYPNWGYDERKRR